MSAACHFHFGRRPPHSCAEVTRSITRLWWRNPRKQYLMRVYASHKLPNTSIHRMCVGFKPATSQPTPGCRKTRTTTETWYSSCRVYPGWSRAHSQHAQHEQHRSSPEHPNPACQTAIAPGQLTTWRPSPSRPSTQHIMQQARMRSIGPFAKRDDKRNGAHAL